MDRLRAPGIVPFALGDRAPLTGDQGLATDGDPLTGINPTLWPAYGGNMIFEEIRNAVIQGGMVPSDADWTQLAQAIVATIAAQTRYLGHFAFLADFSGASHDIPPGTLVPAGSRKVFVEMVGGGGAGGSGNTGGGGGGSGGAGVRGWFDAVGGATITGTAGAGAVTTPTGSGGSPPAASTLTIGGTLIATCACGSNGALGGSPVVAGSTAFGTVPSFLPDLEAINGQSGGNGILSGGLLIGGQGGASMYGVGGLATFTPNVSGGTADGNTPSFFGAAGAGATGSGTGGKGGPGAVNLWFFG